MKKTLAMLLCLALTAGLFAGLTLSATADETLDYPFSDENGEPLRYTWFAELHSAAAAVLKNRGEGEIWQYWEDKFGIEIEWEHPSGALADAFNLLVASGDYPDIIEYSGWPKYPGGPDQAIADGIIVDLTDYYESYCVNSLAYFEEEPLARYQLTSSEGRLWGFSKIFPNEDPWYGIAIRQDMLDACGKEMPETIEDWYDVLTAFKANGVAAPLNFDENAFTTYGCFIGAWDILRNFYVNQDGTVHYGPIESNYKDFLTEMHKWYEEGLIDQEFASIDTSARNSKNLSGVAGAWTGSVAESVGTYNATMAGTGYVAVGAPYPKLDDEAENPRFRQFSNPVRNYFVTISTECENIPQICTALDWMIGDEGSFTCTFGMEGVAHYIDDNGDPQPTELLTKDPDGNAVVNMLCKYAMHFGPFRCDKREAYFIADDQLYLDAQKTWLDSASTDGLLPPYSMTAEESLEFASLMSEIRTYMDEMYLKYVIGLESLDGFDNYVATIEGMGIERALEIQNTAYQRYLELTKK